MNKRLWVTAAASAALIAGIAYGQGQIMDRVADKVIQKYQTASCEQLWQQKGQPKSPEEERVVGATSEAAISRMIDKHVGAATAA